MRQSMGSSFLKVGTVFHVVVVLGLSTTLVWGQGRSTTMKGTLKVSSEMPDGVVLVERPPSGSDAPKDVVLPKLAEDPISKVRQFLSKFSGTVSSLIGEGKRMAAAAYMRDPVISEARMKELVRVGSPPPRDPSESGSERPL